MTAPCVIVGRLKDDKIISICTNFPGLFCLCFEEEDFLKMVNESETICNKKEFDIDNYVNSPIVPCGIGIIFYDYKNKCAFSCQNHWNILDFPIYKLTTSLLRFYQCDKDKERFSDLNEYMFGEKTEELKNNIIEKLKYDLEYFAMCKGIQGKPILTYSDLDNLLYEDDSQRIIYKAFNKIKNEGRFKSKFNNQEIKMSGSNIFEDLDSLHIKDKDKDNYLKIDPYLAFLDIEYPEWHLIDYPEWHVTDATKIISNTLNLLKNYLDKENLLSESNKVEWDKFIAEEEKGEEE